MNRPSKKSRHSRPATADFFRALTAAQANDWDAACRHFSRWRADGFGPLKVAETMWDTAVTVCAEFERKVAIDTLDVAPQPGDPWDWEPRASDAWIEFLSEFEFVLKTPRAEVIDRLHAQFRAVFFRPQNAPIPTATATARNKATETARSKAGNETGAPSKPRKSAANSTTNRAQKSAKSASPSAPSPTPAARQHMLW